MSALENHQEADRVIAVHFHLWSQAKEVTRQDIQVISDMTASPPTVVFLT